MLTQVSICPKYRLGQLHMERIALNQQCLNIFFTTETPSSQRKEMNDEQIRAIFTLFLPYFSASFVPLWL